MINQNELFQKWMADLATNPPKTTGKLCRIRESTGRDMKPLRAGHCCLGRLCEVAELPRHVDDVNCGIVGFDFGDVDRVDFPETHWIAERLNLTRQGYLTDEGIDFAKEFCVEKGVKVETMCLKLSAINDDTDIDLKTMGQLIEHLAKLEREQGIECFQSP